MLGVGTFVVRFLPAFLELVGIGCGLHAGLFRLQYGDALVQALPFIRFFLDVLVQFLQFIRLAPVELRIRRLRLDQADALRVAEKLRRAVLDAGASIGLTCSIGVAEMASQ